MDSFLFFNFIHTKQVCLNLSEDSDLGTRLIQSRCVRELVSAFNNEPLDVLHDVAPYIRAQLEHSSAQVVTSGVVSLAEAARASASVAPIIVAQLVLLSSKQPTQLS